MQVMWESVSVLQVMWESVSVLQVMWESVLLQIMHAAFEREMKLKVRYDKIIITII